jgi:hypothetical protein
MNVRYYKYISIFTLIYDNVLKQFVKKTILKLLEGS